MHRDFHWYEFKPGNTRTIESINTIEAVIFDEKHISEITNADEPIWYDMTIGFRTNNLAASLPTTTYYIIYDGNDRFNIIIPLLGPKHVTTEYMIDQSHYGTLAPHNMTMADKVLLQQAIDRYLTTLV